MTGLTVADELLPCLEGPGNGYAKADEDCACVGVALVGFRCLVFLVGDVLLGNRVIAPVFDLVVTGYVRVRLPQTAGFEVGLWCFVFLVPTSLDVVYAGALLLVATIPRPPVCDEAPFDEAALDETVLDEATCEGATLE